MEMEIVICENGLVDVINVAEVTAVSEVLIPEGEALDLIEALLVTSLLEVHAKLAQIREGRYGK